MLTEHGAGELIEFEMERSGIMKKENDWSRVVGAIVRDKEGEHALATTRSSKRYDNKNQGRQNRDRTEKDSACWTDDQETEDGKKKKASRGSRSRNDERRTCQCISTLFPWEARDLDVIMIFSGELVRQAREMITGWPEPRSEQ